MSWYEDSLGDLDLIGDDEMGDLDLIGDDDVGDDDVGAAPRRIAMPGRRRVRRARFQAPIERYRTQAGRVYEERTPQRDRRLILGASVNFGPAAGVAGSQIAPQVPFRCERVVCATDDPNGVDNYVVEDIIIGTRSQLAFSASGGIAAGVFAATAFGTEVSFDTAHAGLLIQVRVQKLSATSLGTALRITLFGRALVP